MSSNIEFKNKSKGKSQDTINENIEEDLGENVITLPRKNRWLLFSILIILNILMSIDHGTIPAATAQIRHDLDINDAILGVFGSLVYAGSILGSLLSISLINLFNRKYLMIVSITLCGICLLLFTIKQHYLFLFINRTFVGALESFIGIYLPVWSDQFGIKSKKTMMIAMVQLCSILGVVLGYSLTTLFTDDYGWKISFIIEAISIIALSLSLALFSDTYFKSTIRRDYKLSNRKNSYFYDEDQNQLNKVQVSTTNNKGLLKIMNQFKTIFEEPIYIFSVATFSCLLFVVTCVQYWASDYMMTTLGIENENTRLLSFSIVSLTSPLLGVILGGIVISYVGGYESRHSIVLCLCFAVLSFLFTIPAPLVNTLFSFTVFLWMILFFGGAIIAPINGIIISSFPKEYAGSANSISYFFCHLIGKLPAPYIYGAIKTHYSGRIAMMVSMWISILAVIFLVIATILRYKNFARIQKYAIDFDKFIGDLNSGNKETNSQENQSQSISQRSNNNFIH